MWQVALLDELFKDIEFLCSAESGSYVVRAILEFGMPQHDPSKIGCDNSSVVLISRAAASFKSSLYLARRAVFVQEGTQEGHCEVEDVDTKLNYSDILSKSFHKSPKLFATHRDRLLNTVSLMPA